jgi:hypothetical protein
MSAPSTFHGWACHGKGKPYNDISIDHLINVHLDEKMVWQELKLRAEDDYSVDMDVTHCGICGSDLHTMDGYAQ